MGVKGNMAPPGAGGKGIVDQGSGLVPLEPICLGQELLGKRPREEPWEGHTTRLIVDSIPSAS